MKTEEDVLREAVEQEVKYVRLQFVDFVGKLKDVEIPVSQLEKALNNEIMFDGSSVEGFVQVEESDMQLAPDPNTFTLLPWKDGKVARLICDVNNPDGTTFKGCPRGILKKAIADAEAAGYRLNVGPEPEFFLFKKDDNGNATTLTHDEGGYFDEIVDKEEKVLRGIVENLEKIGFELETSHQENAPGQYEIDFKYDDALVTADKVITFKSVVRAVSHKHKLHATFMPKPFADNAGSCMHTHQSIFKGEKNIFYSAENEMGLSDDALYYIGGLLKYAREITAITNPIVNSYKRLGYGFEAPIFVAWSKNNRTSLVRIPAAHSNVGTRIELRSPDPSCNPYLALAVTLKAGLKGIEDKIKPPKPLDGNVYELEKNGECESNGIERLPKNLGEAIEALECSSLVRDVLGEHVFKHFIIQKKKEWEEYCKEIHPWEIKKYLNDY